jgi:hypothetical protein
MREAALPRIRKVCAIALISVMGVIFLPKAASAEAPDLTPFGVPPEVQQVLEDVYNQLPPEVQMAIDDAVADVLTQLITGVVPPVDGLGTEAVTPNSASTSVADFPGLLEVGKSETSTTHSRVKILSVLGQDVLTKDGDATGGTYGGAAAPAGAAVDQVNTALCPGGPVAPYALSVFAILLPRPDPTGTCIAVASSNATTTSGPTPSNGQNNAQFWLVHIHSDAVAEEGDQNITIGYTAARTTRSGTATQGVGTRCASLAQSVLVSGRGRLGTLILLHPGGPIAGISPTSSGAAVVCNPPAA